MRTGPQSRWQNLLDSLHTYWLVRCTSIFTQSPPLLQVNLIMDTMGALALATEDPSPELLTEPPYGRDEPLINARMWTHIAVQARGRAGKERVHASKTTTEMECPC